VVEATWLCQVQEFAVIRGNSALSIHHARELLVSVGLQVAFTVCIEELNRHVALQVGEHAPLNNVVEVLLLPVAERPSNQIRRILLGRVRGLEHGVLPVLEQIPREYVQLFFTVVNHNKLHQISHTRTQHLGDPNFLVHGYREPCWFERQPLMVISGLDFVVLDFYATLHDQVGSDHPGPVHLGESYFQTGQSLYYVLEIVASFHDLLHVHYFL
jgi:hypothetical protein